jgi:hypothetical protein
MPAGAVRPHLLLGAIVGSSNPSGAGMLARTVVGSERRSVRKKWRSSMSMPTGGIGTRRVTAASAALTD